jgi:AAA+ superfamily predicted ATPase
MGKPLLIVNVSEVGINPAMAERKFQRLYSLAMRWEAILLLDEADVMLEERQRADLGRNALVSVLLRVLEYSQGIIIMTSNRVGVFDEAVRSRINLAVRYPQLTKDQSSAIFNYFINQLGSNVEHCLEGRYEVVVDATNNSNLNGRQIRNVISAALSLARYEASKTGATLGNNFSETEGQIFLEENHIRQVCEAVTDFDDYLIAVHGVNNEGMSRESRVR